MSIIRLIILSFLMISIGDINCGHSDISCDDELPKVKSIEAFNKFFNLVKKDKLEGQLERCLSLNRGGLNDLEKMQQVVDLRNKLDGGICQSSYADKLLELHEEMERHKVIFKIGPSRHGLRSFYKAFVGRVIKTCKMTLVDKISEAISSSEFTKSLEILPEDLSLRSSKECNRKGCSSLLGAIIKKSKADQKVENLILVDELERTSGAAFLIFVQVPNEKKMKEIEELRQACKVIDSYAENSIKPIARLAMHGFIETTSDYIPTDWRETFNKWLVSEQLCQGIMIARPIIGRIPEEIKDITNQIGSASIIMTFTDKKIKERFSNDDDVISQHKFIKIAGDKFDDSHLTLNHLASMHSSVRLIDRVTKPNYGLLYRTTIRNWTGNSGSSEDTLWKVLKYKIRDYDTAIPRILDLKYFSTIPYHEGAVILLDAIMSGYTLIVVNPNK